MKELTGTATAAVAAPADQTLALLAAVDRYPTWYPEVVQAVEVLERDASGQPTRVNTRLHMSQGPLSKDFELTMTVAVTAPSTVQLTRVPNEPGDEERFEVTWHVDSPAPGQIRVDLLANLSVPRLLPVGGIGNAMAGGFVQAAVRALAPQPA